jgi:hypothetical protein
VKAFQQYKENIFLLRFNISTGEGLEQVAFRVSQYSNAVAKQVSAMAMFPRSFPFR